MGLFTIKEISKEANTFKSFLNTQVLMSVGAIVDRLLTLSVQATYSETYRNTLVTYYSKLLKSGKIKSFDVNVVVEYLNYANDNLEPKTWIYNKSAYINRINTYYRGYAYYKALTNN